MSSKQTKLEKHMEENYSVIGKHKDFIREAVAVLEFFSNGLQKTSPHAKHEISALGDAIDYLEMMEED